MLLGARLRRRGRPHASRRCCASLGEPSHRARLRQQPAPGHRWSACSAPRSASCSPSRRCAPACGRHWLRAARRGDAAAADLAAVHHLDRVHLLVRAARASSPTTCWASPTSAPTAWTTHAAAETLTYFPDRLSDAAADPGGDRSQSRGDGVQPRRLALAHLPHRHPAAGRAGLRQRLPAAVRGLARRLRDAADPGRQCLPGAADPGLSADHRPVRLQGRRGAVAAAAGAGRAGLPAAAPLGRRGAPTSRSPARPASARASQRHRAVGRRARWSPSASRWRRSSSISMRCCSTPRWCVAFGANNTLHAGATTT